MSLVQHKTANSTSASTATTAAADYSAANFLVAVVRCYYDGSNTCTASDSSSNTWSAGPTISNIGDNLQINIRYVCVPTVTSSQTFTVTASAGRTNVWIDALGYSGAINTAGCNDGAGTSAKGSPSTSCAPGSITPGTANDVFITGTTGSKPPTAFSIGSSFTVEDSTASSAANGAGADLVVSGTPATNPSWTLTGNTSATALCVMQPFKPSAGGGGATFSPGLMIQGVGD